MQPRSINEKTLMITSVGLNASKTRKILSLFHLILKIFTLKQFMSKIQHLHSTVLKKKHISLKLSYHSKAVI